ncbi:MAG TPA: NYN domain-containing protein [Kiritimatiellia bacterium]|nr:NYN domain-containing protein [Kiritimatiellia bacterium]
MSLLGKIAALFGGGEVTRRVCVVDGDRMVGGDRVGPGERFQALSKLARFATREGMDMKVVFGGRPLREAEDGSTYNGVQVFYAENATDVQKRIGKTLASVGRSHVVLVTSDQVLEQEMNAKGFASMRVSTLRKSMELAGGEGGDRGDRGGNRDRDRDRDHNRRNRNRNRGPRRPQNENNQGGTTPAESQAKPAESAPPSNGGAGGKDSVKSLIDLVE